MNLFNEAQTILNKAELIYSAAQIHQAMDEMAAKLNQLFENKNPQQPVIVLSVMNGGLILTGQLLTRLNFPLHVDYLHASRYRNETQGGDLQWKVEPQNNLQGRQLLIIDDILDEGYTLKSIQQYCQQQQAADIISAVLVEKQHTRRVPNVSCDVIGMTVEDRYVFGFGMDYKGYHRNVNGIYAVAEEQ